MPLRYRTTPSASSGHTTVDVLSAFPASTSGTDVRRALPLGTPTPTTATSTLAFTSAVVLGDHIVMPKVNDVADVPQQGDSTVAEILPLDVNIDVVAAKSDATADTVRPPCRGQIVHNVAPDTLTLPLVEVDGDSENRTTPGRSSTSPAAPPRHTTTVVSSACAARLNCTVDTTGVNVEVPITATSVPMAMSSPSAGTASGTTLARYSTKMRSCGTPPSGSTTTEPALLFTPTDSADTNGRKSEIIATTGTPHCRGSMKHRVPLSLSKRLYLATG